MIRWPDDLRPAAAAVYSRNELATDLPPDRIWPWLVRAERWHEHYSNCRRLRLLDEAGPDLQLGTRFSWWTFGVPVTTVIEELVPGERLAWRGVGAGACGYHAWLLERHAGRTRFVTEEVQRRVAPWLLRFALRPAIHHFHQRWLEGLVRVARLGHPDHVKEIS